MGNDEKMVKAFKYAAKNGYTELTARELTLITGMPARSVRDRIESMKKYGEVKDGVIQKSRFFRPNPQML